MTVIPENTPALSFWRSIVSRFTGGKFTEAIRRVGFDQEQPRRHVLSFTT